jgi:hypothetical protein
MRKGRQDNFECFWKQGQKEKECNNIIFFSSEVQNGEKDVIAKFLFFSFSQNYGFLLQVKEYVLLDVGRV